MESSFYHIPHAKPKRSILDAFPVPEFLQMHGAGLDISDRSLKVLDLERDKGVYSIRSSGIYEISSGAIDGGHIKDDEMVRSAVRTAQSEHKLAFVQASLPEERTYLFETTVEGAAAQALQENIEFHLEENVPLTPQESIFDFEVFREYEKKGRQFKDVSVSVVSREVTENYADILRSVGVIPIAMLIEAHAVARAVVPHKDDSAYMIIDLGRTRTGVSVVSDGATRFTTSVDIGGEHLTNIISKGLQLPFPEAEALKKERGTADDRTKELLGEQCEHLAGEIENNMNYWNSTLDERGGKNKKISSVILAGGGALLPGFERFLKRKLSTDVHLANVWVNTPFAPHVVPDITFEESLRYAGAVGLAL